MVGGHRRCGASLAHSTASAAVEKHLHTGAGLAVSDLYEFSITSVERRSDC